HVRSTLASATPPPPRAWVEPVPHRIAEYIDAEYGQAQHQRGEGQQPPCGIHVDPTLPAEHRAPCRRRWRDAKPEEAERRFGDDDRSKVDREEHKCGR